MILMVLIILKEVSLRLHLFDQKYTKISNIVNIIK